MPPRRPQLAELGLFLLVVALPLVFTPFSASPFGDPKLVVLAGGTLALWASGPPVDRRLAWAAAAWVIATLGAALVGVDVSVGLSARTEGQGGGLILIACAGALAVLGAGLPAELRERGRRWFVASAAVVATIGLAIRVSPDISSWVPGDIELIGATLGNQVFAAALLAAAVAAAMGRPIVASSDGSHDRVPWLHIRTVALVAFLALGLATFGERSSIVLPVVAAAAMLWRARLGLRTSLVMAAAVFVPILAWQVLDATAFPDTTGRGDAVTGITAQSTDLQRFTVWNAMSRAAVERPVLGWGPGSARSAYLATASGADIEETGRQWHDAHNLFIETGVTTGALGLATLLWLVALLVARSLRAARDRAWAFGAAVGLATYSIVEPVGLVLTPLLFLFAGVAAGPRPPALLAAEGGVTPAMRSRAATRVVAALLAVGSIVSLQMLAAASLERWGRVYGETWALEGALRIQPWRLSSAERLALSWALDGRAGDTAAASRARDEIGDAVQAHPWDGDVRLWAADIETLLRDESEARAWVERHIERFPGDASGLSGARGGDPENQLQVRESAGVLTYAPADEPRRP